MKVLNMIKSNKLYKHLIDSTSKTTYFGIIINWLNTNF